MSLRPTTRIGGRLLHRRSYGSAALLETVRATARRLQLEVFLVGGTVRDLLLGAELIDLDLVVAGDALLLAREVARVRDARLEAHPAFGTASLVHAGEGRLDLASARSEEYASPAAPPSRIMPADIRRDLLRRDFSINAMALPLEASGSARLLDPTSGRRDLERGLIRVLHPRSFLDDPTRALRAARFASRFGFRLARETRVRLTEAVVVNSFRAVEVPRLEREYERLASEPRLASAVSLLETWGVWRALLPALRLDREAMARLGRLEAMLREPALQNKGIGPDRFRLVLALLAASAPVHRRGATLARMAGAGSGRSVQHLLASGERLRARLPGGPPEPDAWRAACRGVARDVLLLLEVMERDPLRRLALARLRRQASQLRLGVRGRDLVRAGIQPGPEIGRRLEATFRARLRGELPADRGSELAFALSAAAGARRDEGSEPDGG